MSGTFHGMVSEAKRLLATLEFRNIKNKSERVARLVTEKGISFRAAASASGMSLGAVQRAFNAIKRGDQPGELGRPSALTKEEEQQLLDSIHSDHAALNSVPPSLLIEKASSGSKSATPLMLTQSDYILKGDRNSGQETRQIRGDASRGNDATASHMGLGEYFRQSPQHGYQESPDRIYQQRTRGSES